MNGIKIGGLQNGPQDGNSTALQIIIVGAGIGGFAAAIALRRKGHEVTMYERSQFKAEHGAAITMAPNAVGALESLGLDIEADGAVRGEWQTIHDHEKLVSRRSLLDDAANWQNKYLMAHRVDLHNGLRRAATDPDAAGHPVKLHLGAKVKRVDAEHAMVEFEDGTAAFADVVIGADGVSSVTRCAISDVKPFPSGKSAFRFTLDRQTIFDNPATREFVKLNGEMRLMSTKTQFNKILNIAVIHPDEDSATSTAAANEYNHGGDKDVLLSISKVFGSEALALLDMVQPEDLKLWRLHDMAVLEHWTKGKLALLGDAAHPFMPYQAQGGAIAIEDAVALGEVLPLGTTRGDVPARLKLYESLRKDRADRVQHNTRVSGRVETDYMGKMARGGITMKQTYPYNEYHHASDKFRRYMYEQNAEAKLSMPISFGPFPTQRQDVSGRARPSDGQAGMCRTTLIEFKTSRTLLENMLPNSQFAFVNEFHSVVPAVLRVQQFSNMSWLGGQGYNTLSLYIPGIRYTKTDGTTVEASYPVVIFEDLPEAVISDREELGLPALYASMAGGLSQDGRSFSFLASWKGTTFVKVEINNLSAADSTSTSTPTPTPTPSPPAGLLSWRYLPALTLGVNAHTEHAIYIPPTKGSGIEGAPCADRGLTTSTEASISWLDAGRKTLPTLSHIVERLAALPVFEVTRATVFDEVPARSDSQAIQI